MGADGEYKRQRKAFARFAGTQHRHVYPIHRDLVVRLLRLEPSEYSGAVCAGPEGGCKACWSCLFAWRKSLCCVCHTIEWMRPDEGHNAQICDSWPDYDLQAGYAEFAGGAAPNISQQKDDACSRGAQKRFGRSADPDLDFVDQMKQLHQ